MAQITAEKVQATLDLIEERSADIANAIDLFIRVWQTTAVANDIRHRVGENTLRIDTKAQNAGRSRDDFIAVLDDTAPIVQVRDWVSWSYKAATVACDLQVLYDLL